jgi:hypothetical protein
MSVTMTVTRDLKTQSVGNYDCHPGSEDTQTVGNYDCHPGSEDTQSD